MNSRESAEKATKALNGKVFEEHHLRVDLCFKPDAEKSVHERNKRSVFVGNLPLNIKDDVLWTAFAKAGEVESVRVIRDKKTGAGKGFGYGTHLRA